MLVVENYKEETGDINIFGWCITVQNSEEICFSAASSLLLSSSFSARFHLVADQFHWLLCFPHLLLTMFQSLTNKAGTELNIR